jgi:hypothetical protein
MFKRSANGQNGAAAAANLIQKYDEPRIPKFAAR